VSGTEYGHDAEGKRYQRLAEGQKERGKREPISFVSKTFKLSMSIGLVLGKGAKDTVWGLWVWDLRGGGEGSRLNA